MTDTVSCTVVAAVTAAHRQRCAVCGGQMISCGSRFDEDPSELFDDEDEPPNRDRVVSLLPRLSLWRIQLDDCA